MRKMTLEGVFVGGIFVNEEASRLREITTKCVQTIYLLRYNQVYTIQISVFK